jgi:excisionase family DNA binding protein
VDTQPNIISPYLTVEEAAAYLRSTKHGIYSLVKRGRIKPMPGRPGRLLFTREALDKYLNSRFHQ